MADLIPLDDDAMARWKTEQDAAIAAVDDAHWGYHLPEPQLPERRREGFAVVRQGVEVGRLAFRQLDVSTGWLLLEALWVHPEHRGRGQAHQLFLVAEAEVRRRHLGHLRAAVPVACQSAAKVVNRGRMVRVASTRRVDLARTPDVRPARLDPVNSREKDLRHLDVHDLMVAAAGSSVYVDHRRRVGAVGLRQLPGVAWGTACVVATGTNEARRLPEVVAAVCDLARDAGMTHLNVEIMGKVDGLLPEPDYPIYEVSTVKRV